MIGTMTNRLRFDTTVRALPPTPLGLLGSRWAIDHRCVECHQLVQIQELVHHAESHGIHLDGPVDGSSHF